MIGSSYLPRRLPEPIRELAALATDLRWTWSHESDVLWRVMDPETWEKTENPYVVLQNLTETRLAELAADPEFRQQLQALEAKRQAYLSEPGWFGETHGAAGMRGIGYFSMEFGLGEALPLYAGGLGILAGDCLKAASDLGVPMTAVGLLYQEGYFRQVLDSDGWQQEAYPYNDRTILPVFPVAASTGAWLKVEVELPGRVVRCRVWRARVGRVGLYLLDSNDPLNSPLDRGITGKLYGGGEEMRLVQEMVLGIGGWRMIAALGLPMEVCHLNEGHAAFVTLERARQVMQQHGIGFGEALWLTRPGNLFTTHTPVAAGFDSYSPALVERYGRVYAEQFGVSLEALAGLGRFDPQDSSGSFNMACLAARTCGAINAVSRLHGEVSRQIFQNLYPRWPRIEVPVGHITNGAHVPTWDSPWADQIWTRACGRERWRGGTELLQEAMEGVGDEELWEFNTRERGDLVDYVRDRLAYQCGQRGDDAERVAAAARVLDPQTLTLGFARRFAAYKRPNLLLHDPDRLIRILTRPERPVQIIVAGKAHPADQEGKRFIQQWARFVRHPEVRLRAVFLEDYDMALAQKLVQGVDVWINTPRRPWEACGTSGMKVLVNGGLNLSVRDGWWAEAFDPEVGWTFGDSGESGSGRDAEEAAQLYALLEDEIAPLFYERDEGGIPRRWVARMRTSLARLAPRFSATRMVRDYVEKFYLQASRDYRLRNEAGPETGRALRVWEDTLHRSWHQIRWGQRRLRPGPGGMEVEIAVSLGDLPPDSIQVELYADGPGGGSPVRLPMTLREAVCGVARCYRYVCTIDDSRPAGDYTARIIPNHPLVRLPIETNLISWEA